MTIRPAPRDWDAATYERVSDAMTSWGLEVLQRLPLEGDETIVDAGCGTGRLTVELIDRLPDGNVVAVDGSASMIAAVRKRLRPQDGAVCVNLLDLELDLPEPIDAIFSTATFHWIADHERLFERLFALLPPGGRLVAQCGGAGNLGPFAEHLATAVREPAVAATFAGWPGPWNFAGPDETTALLEAAGFADVHCWLEQRDVWPDEPDPFLRTVILGSHLDRLPEDRRDAFVARVLELAGTPLMLPYIRLNIDAVRPG